MFSVCKGKGNALFKRMLKLPFRLGSEQDALEIRDYQGVLLCVCVAGGGGSPPGLLSSASQGREISVCCGGGGIGGN